MPLFMPLPVPLFTPPACGARGVQQLSVQLSGKLSGELSGAVVRHPGGDIFGPERSVSDS